MEWKLWSWCFDQRLQINPYTDGENSADKIRAIFVHILDQIVLNSCAVFAPPKPRKFLQISKGQNALLI